MPRYDYPVGTAVIVTLRAGVKSHSSGVLRLGTAQGTTVAIQEHGGDLDPDLGIALADPPGWPPQAGDVWTTDEPNGNTETWFIYTSMNEYNLGPTRNGLCARSGSGTFLDDSEMPPGLRERRPTLAMRGGFTC